MVEASGQSSLPSSCIAVPPRSSGRRVTLVAVFPLEETSFLSAFPNYGVRRVWAGLLADPRLDDAEVTLIEAHPETVDGLLERVLATAPSVVAMSTYIWSFEGLLRLADGLRRHLPDVTIVMGGPSARGAVLDLEIHVAAAASVDALVLDAGEATLCDIVALRDRSVARLGDVPGLALRRDGVWRPTGKRPAVASISETPSAYAYDLMPSGFGYLETYKGCPLSCSYCEWGAMGDAKNVLSVDYLAAEFGAMERVGVNGVLLVDAALNLNPHAFRNLAEAARQTQFFATRQFLCEVYPAALNDAHMAFLTSVARPSVGVGLQSMDPEVLAQLDRPFDPARFESVVRELASHVPVSIEIILGLPSDNARSFRKTFDRLRELPCTLRVYHCVVLPSGLMSRAAPDFAMSFDPRTLKMLACKGWPEAELQREVDYLTRVAQSEPGASAGTYLWSFHARPDATRGRLAAATSGPARVWG